MKKTLTMVLAFALVFALGVGGTLAWLTDSTEEVVNTFTTSDIGVALKESENLDLQMVPGHTITKDPKAWVTTGSEEAWLFVEITKSANFDTYMTYELANGWTTLKTEGNVIVICKEITTDMMGETNASEIIKDNKVTVKGSVTKEMMNALTAETQPTLTFKAYASQLYKNAGTKFEAAEAWHNISDPTDAVEFNG